MEALLRESAPLLSGSLFTFSCNGDRLRVVILHDVVSVPEWGWSCGGFGSWISEEWLLTQSKTVCGVKFPGRTKAEKQKIAWCIMLAVEEHAKAIRAARGGAK